MVFNTNDFYDPLQQLPPPILITGCTKLDHHRKMVENILTKHNLSVLNDISSTYIHPAAGSSTAIDLSICSPDIFLDMQWKTLDYLCGSDHYPIFTACGNARIASTVLATAIPSVRLSVCPSLTRRYCVKTTARSTVQFAPLDSKMCLVL